MHESQKYLDPQVLARLQGLQLRARLIVEGYVAGVHRSPFHGFSIEFAEHREYTPGVDPRHIDWRVYGRRDKLYVKQYEEETSLRCYLLLDRSGSMAYKHRAPLSKLEYGCFLSASLAYLMAMQHDAVGLITYDTGVGAHIPPRQGQGHLRVLLEHMEKTEAGGETSLSDTFHQLAETIRRRALVVVISDLFDDPQRLVEALKHFRHKKHEVIVFHTLDPAELTFPFDDITSIEDMENRREVMSDPRAFRKAYLEGLDTFLKTIRSGCEEAQIDYSLAETDKRFDLFLGAYLARRERMGA